MPDGNKAPKLSIIIPVHNVEKYIKECTDSFLAQEFTDYEMILVENASTDKSAEICDKIAQTDERIRAIHKKRGGLSYARNVGLTEARGEYVLYFDSDDMLPGECLKEIMSKMEREKADFMICGSCSFIDGKDEVTQIDFDVDEKTMQLGGIWTLREFFKKETVSWHACRVISQRRFIIKNELFFNEAYNAVEDGDFFFRAVLNADKIGISKTNLLKYRQNRKNSISNTISVKNVRSIFDVYTKWQNFFCEVYSINQSECILRGMSNALYYVMLSLIKTKKRDRKEIYRICHDNIDALKYVRGKKKKLMYYIYKLLGMHIGLWIADIGLKAEKAKTARAEKRAKEAAKKAAGKANEEAKKATVR